MKIRILLTGLALMAGLGAASAQDMTGRVISGPYFDTSHRLLFSQNDYVFGTSRSAAMGGAFASLGADLSSMNINPAGLGMYQSSDWNFTQALTIDGMQTSSPLMPASTLDAKGNRVSYGLNNLGIAFNAFNKSSGLTSLTFGFGYNRAANFNSRTYIDTYDERSSITDMFARQLDVLGGRGLGPNSLDYGAYPFGNRDVTLDTWGAVLGYQTGLLSNDSGGYFPNTGASSVGSYFGSVTRGGIYEYSLSMGANVSNILYFGATLGISQINYHEETSYEEYYGDDSMFTDMWYDQTKSIRGSGFTAKFGAIVRPVSALRIGVAFHLPTYYDIEMSYTGKMGAMSTRGGEHSAMSDLVDDELRLDTAPRLLAGISGVIADRAVIAVDWEMAWYNLIAERRDGIGRILDTRRNSEREYKPAHTFRAGVEVLVTDIFSLRAGGSYMLDFMKDKNYISMGDPTVKSAYNITAGVGFKLGRTGYLDLTYVYNRSEYTDYDFYYFDDGDTWTGQHDGPEGSEIRRRYTPLQNRHMITLTLGNRF